MPATLSAPAAPGSAAALNTTVPASAPHKDSFLSKLGHLGHDALTKVLPVLTHTAAAAEPMINLLFPMQGPLYANVVDAICKAEVEGAKAAASAPGGGAQKFEAVWKAASPELLAAAQKNGLVSADADAAVKRYIQAIFNVLDGPAKVGAGVPAAA